MYQFIAQAQRGNLGTIAPPPQATVNLGAFVGTLVNFAIGSGAVIFLGVFFWGSFEWLTAAGDKGRLDQAKSRMTAGAVGLAILATSYAVFYLVRAITYNV